MVDKLHYEGTSLNDGGTM